MNISKKAICFALTLLVATNISTANAQAVTEKENAVLFKIHDIVPVKNADGEVFACDFNTTLFNRSSFTIKEAALSLDWIDTSIENVIKDEKNESAKRDNSMERSYSETERSTVNGINVEVPVSTIRPNSQVTIPVRVNSDRCFLLIEPVNFTVKNCSADGVQENRRVRQMQGGVSGCSKLFKFIAPQDAQYYLDFKEISLDEQETKTQEAKKENKAEVEKMYRDAIGSMENAGSLVSGIK